MSEILPPPIPIPTEVNLRVLSCACESRYTDSVAADTARPPPRLRVEA